MAGHPVSQALCLSFKRSIFDMFEGIYHTLDKSLAVLHFFKFNCYSDKE